jgi:hypothetical protein
MDLLEREVRAMLKDKAAEMPQEYEPSTELLGRTSRRRTNKVMAVGIVSALVLLAGVTGVVAATRSSSHVQVQTPPPKPVVINHPKPKRPKSTPPSGAASYVVTRTGKIGSVTLGASTEADVRRALGAPANVQVANVGVSGYPQFRALGYECDKGSSSRQEADPIQAASNGTTCSTRYFVNTTNGRLVGFWTTSSTYSTDHGTQVGMTAAEAVQHEGQAVPTIGCDIGTMILGSRQTGPEVHIGIGTSATAHVKNIGEVAKGDPIGLFFC